MNTKPPKSKSTQKSTATRASLVASKTSSKKSTNSQATIKPASKSRKANDAAVKTATPTTIRISPVEMPPFAPTAPAASKQSQLLALLQSTSGATMAQMLDATGWQAHSIRGCISAVFRKKMGLVVERISQGSERAYRIAA